MGLIAPAKNGHADHVEVGREERGAIQRLQRLDHDQVLLFRSLTWHADHVEVNSDALADRREEHGERDRDARPTREHVVQQRVARRVVVHLWLGVTSNRVWGSDSRAGAGAP
jgi:hypothetical protein